MELFKKRETPLDTAQQIVAAGNCPYWSNGNFWNDVPKGVSPLSSFDVDCELVPIAMGKVESSYLEGIADRNKEYVTSELRQSAKNDRRWVMVFSTGGTLAAGFSVSSGKDAIHAYNAWQKPVSLSDFKEKAYDSCVKQVAQDVGGSQEQAALTQSLTQ